MPVLPPGPEAPYDLGFKEDILAKITEYTEAYGPIFKVYSPTRKKYTYVANQPEYVQHVLVTKNRNYTKGVGIERVKLLLGHGIMVSEGDYWKRQRRMIQPLFHKQVIAQLATEMREENHRLRQRWAQAAQQGQQVNITQAMSETTLEVVLKALFSTDLEAINTQHNQPFNLLTEETARDLTFAMKFRGLAKLIKAVKDQRLAQGRTETDFLSMLMATTDKDTGQPMSEKELLDEVMTLIVAGHETTASVLNFAWLLIAQHPEVEQQMLAEVQQLGGQVPTFEQLSQIPYTKQVIEETMRLYPPGWMLTRRAIADDQLGQYFVEAGTDIFLIPYMIHRNPAHWPNPERFNPDRFAAGNDKQRHKFAYFPFAAGPRQCIGDFFSLVEMQLHLAYLLQHFSPRYSGPAQPPVEPQVNLRSKDDIVMTMVPR